VTIRAIQSFLKPGVTWLRLHGKSALLGRL
jgi:hypothetical protein